MTGRKFSEEHKLNLTKSNARRGKVGTFRNRKHSADSLKKIGDRPYPTDGEHPEARALVINDIWYASMNTAERALGISANTLRDLAKGRAKKSRKYPWIKTVTYGDQYPLT